MAERRRDLYAAPRRRTAKERQYVNPAAFWNRLREMGRNKVWLAGQVGVNPSTIDDYLSGKRRVPHKRADQLLEVLKLPASKLLNRKPPPRITTEAGSRELLALPYVNSENIREEMERQGLTVTELAKRVGVSRRSMTRILGEKQRVTPETQVAISQALDLPREDVIDLEPVDPALDTSRVTEAPTPYNVARAATEGVRLLVRPRHVEGMKEALGNGEAGLPCGCVVYWSGSELPSDDALDVVREHYRSHVEGIMQEPGLVEERPNPSRPLRLPLPSERRSRVLWPSLPNGEGVPKVGPGQLFGGTPPRRPTFSPVSA